MTPAIVLILLGICICVLAQGFFSGSEIAMVSANRLVLESKAKGGHNGAELAVKLLDHEESLLGTCLIGTNLSVVTGTTLVTALLTIFDVKTGLASALVFVPVALIFGETLPKTVFQANADKLAPIVSHPLRWIQIVLSPALIIVRTWSKALEWVTGSGPTIRVTPQDIVQLLEGAQDESIDEEEKRFIKGVFAISETAISECMTPLVNVTSIDAEASVSQAKELAIQTGYSRLLVHKDRVDNTIGILNVHDLLFGADEQDPVEKYLDDPHFVPESKPVDDLLHEMRRDRIHMAVVVDEYGGSAGIITIEDVLEEVIGDIRDERDVERINIFRLGPCEWRIPAQAEMEELAQATGFTIPEGDYETVAGFILSSIGRIPKTGESVRIGEASFLIEEASDRVIRTVRMTLPWASS